MYICTAAMERKDDGGDRFGGAGGRNGKQVELLPAFKTDQSGEVEILKRLRR